MLLESMRIAASRWGRGLEWLYQGREGNTHRIAVAMPPVAGIATDPLLSYIPLRSVDRRRYRLRPLTTAQKAALAAALGPDLQIDWHESLAERWRMARLGAKATAIRLTTPEAFPIHQRVLDWDHALSPTGIPAAASGISRPSLPLMRWAMQSWPRMRLLNRLGGALAGAVQMDYIPGLSSAAFFTIRPAGSMVPGSDPVVRSFNIGQAIQRFWLTATCLDLAVQPNLAPICFANYGRHNALFTAKRRLQDKAERFAAFVEHRVPGTGQQLIFWGRIGAPLPRKPIVRSVRRSWDELLTRTGSRSDQDSLAPA
jgi:hypothetical protein